MTSENLKHKSKVKKSKDKKKKIYAFGMVRGARLFKREDELDRKF